MISAPPPLYPAPVNPVCPVQQQVTAQIAPVPSLQARHGQRFKVTGWLNITAGILSVVLGIIAIIIEAWFSYFATPIWMGLLFFITSGVIGVLASSRNNKGLIIAYMVMCLISCLLAFSFMFTCFAMLSAENTQLYEDTWGAWELYHVCNPGYYRDIHYNCPHKIGGRYAVDGLLAVTALAEGVIAIIGASFCCNALCGGCCCPTAAPAVTTTYTSTGTVLYAGQQSGGTVYVQVPQSTFVMQQGGIVPPPNTGYPPTYAVQPVNTAAGPPQVPGQVPNLAYPPAYPPHPPIDYTYPLSANAPPATHVI